MKNKKDRIYKPDLEKLFSYNTLLLMTAGVIINVFLSRLVIFLHAPLYLDNVGSIMTAVLSGPLPGMVTAFISNYLGYFGEPSAIMFGVLTVTMAWLAAKLSEMGTLRKRRGYLVLWAMMIAVGGCAGSIIGWYLYGETAGGTIALPYVQWLHDNGMAEFPAQFFGDVLLDVTDKAVTALAMASILHSLPVRILKCFPLGYIYRSSDKDLEKKFDADNELYSGASVYDRVMGIITLTLFLSAGLVLSYCVNSYYRDVFTSNHDTYALFSYAVKLAGLEFVIIISSIALSGWLIYRTLKKPIDSIVSQIYEFSKAGNEKWLDSKEWQNRSVIKTGDEVQVLYETICQSEVSICRKMASIQEDKKKFRRLADTDRMTGIRNRGSGEEAISMLIAGGTEGLFCLADCDGFKNINDTYGHAAGDAVLVALANSMKKVCRDSDILMRLGGDEFALFLSGLQTKEQAGLFFNRLFKNTDAISVPEIKGRKIFLSVGAAFSDKNVQLSFDDLYRMADIALYESKKTDGNAANIFRSK